MTRPLAAVWQRQGKLIGQMQGLKYATTEKCSPDTALRDIHELLAAGILKKDESGGRSTSYCLVRA